MSSELPLPTRDPFTQGELVVTRLENPSTGTRIEGHFSLGWIGRLTREQLDLIGLLLERRNNLQQLATDLGVAYNTVRARFDDIVDAITGATTPTTSKPRDSRRAVLERLASGEITTEDAGRLLRNPS